MAVNSPYFLSQILRDRFDIIGVDPRGTNFSDNVRCFGGLGDQAAAFAGFRVPFPRGANVLPRGSPSPRIWQSGVRPQASSWQRQCRPQRLPVTWTSCGALSEATK